LSAIPKNFVPEQAFERFQMRQVRFGAGQPLRAAAPRDGRRASGGQVAQKFFGQRGLPDARLARHREQEPASRAG
jgi:hypothetical protein